MKLPAWNWNSVWPVGTVAPFWYFATKVAFPEDFEPVAGAIAYALQA